MIFKKKSLFAGQWCRTPLIPADRRQSQAHLCELEASIVQKESSRTARLLPEKTCLEKQKKKKEIQFKHKYTLKIILFASHLAI